MITRITAQEAQDALPDLINQVVHNKKKPIIITRRGKEIAALISSESFALLQEIQNKQDLQDALDVLKKAREQGSVSVEKAKEELGV